MLLFAGPRDDPTRYVRVLRERSGSGPNAERVLTIARGQVFADEAGDIRLEAKRVFLEKCTTDGWSEPDAAILEQLQVGFQVLTLGTLETDCVRIGSSVRWVGGWNKNVPQNDRDATQTPEWTHHWVLRQIHFFASALVLPLDAVPAEPGPVLVDQE